MGGIHPCLAQFRLEPIVDMSTYSQPEGRMDVLYHETLLPHRLSRLCNHGENIGEFCKSAEEFDVLQLFDVTVLAHAICAVTDGYGPIGVNVAYSTLSGSHDVILRMLQACPEAARKNLYLEIVENNHISYTSTTDIVTSIKMLGTKIVLDDFGAGLHAGQTPSFFMCRAIPDVIKLDGCVINHQFFNIKKMKNNIGRALEFADRYGCVVVAEKIETEEQFGFLLDSGVRYGQGYYLLKNKPSLCSK